MITINSVQTLRHWLKDKDNHLRHLIAIRASLRALPLGLNIQGRANEARRRLYYEMLTSALKSWNDGSIQGDDAEIVFKASTSNLARVAYAPVLEAAGIEAPVIPPRPRQRQAEPQAPNPEAEERRREIAACNANLWKAVESDCNWLTNNLKNAAQLKKASLWPHSPPPRFLDANMDEGS